MSTGEPEAKNKFLRRDQERAQHAYQSVLNIPHDQRKPYKTAVHSLGATILRSGLAATMSDLERRGGGKFEPSSSVDKLAVWTLREHLARARVPHLSGATSESLPKKIRELEVAEYMLATRETLQVVLWLKRAVQAIISE